MSYQYERDLFIIRMTSEGLPYATILQLLRGAATLQRTAELACSSERADRDRVPCPATTKRGGPCLCDMYQGTHSDIARITRQDYRLEARLRAALPTGWAIESQGDPRGYALRVIPPSYIERNAGRNRFDWDAIGVPTR